MDFSAGEAELAASELAARLLSATGPARASTDAEGPLTDLDISLWKELGQAGLLSLGVPAEAGGDGLGVQATAAVLTEVGRHAARIPALATLALGVLPVTRSDDAEIKALLLSGVGTGETIMTAAIREPSYPMPQVPAAMATLGRRGGTVSGVKIGVPYAAAARWILVPASTLAGDAVVAVVEPDADGLSCQRTPSSSGAPEYTLRLADCPVFSVLEGCSISDLYQFAVAGACAVADGVLAGALELTTKHIGTREQFGRPLATFQAVAQQIADVYAAARTLHLITVSACWQLDSDTEAAERDADIAAYWLAERGPAALRTCHHLHGGLGMDITYPLPRYSALMTDLAAFVGGAEYRLDRLASREAAGA